MFSANQVFTPYNITVGKLPRAVSVRPMGKPENAYD